MNDDELLKLLRKGLGDLTSREKAVLKERFGMDLTSDEALLDAAKGLLVTQQKIAEIERKALRRLRNKDDGPDESA